MVGSIKRFLADLSRGSNSLNSDTGCKDKEITLLYELIPFHVIYLGGEHFTETESVFAYLK